MKKRLSLLCLCTLFASGVFTTNSTFSAENKKVSGGSGSDYKTVVQDGVTLNANFFELGGKDIESLNSFVGGDCTLITFGTGSANDIQILIDCGGSKEDKDSIIDQFKTLMGPDKTLEYLIFSHGDSDHIINFTEPGGFGDFLFNNEVNGYTVKNIIDFDFLKEDGSFVSEEMNSVGWKGVYNNISNLYLTYRIKRDLIIGKHNASYKRITDLINFSNYSSASNSLIDLEVNNSSGKKAVAKMKFLYNYYYDHCKPIDIDIDPGAILNSESSTTYESLIKNNLSVCVAFIYGENQYLFTGDLEEYESSTFTRRYGETYLCYYNPLLHRRISTGDYQNNFDLYKAGHHGSPTSNSEYLLDAIRPSYVYASCVYGSDRYTTYAGNQFLCQDVMNNIFKYTDAIYPMDYCKYQENLETGKAERSGQGLYYGALSFSGNGKKVSVKKTNSNAQTLANPDNHHSITLTPFFDTNNEYIDGTDDYFERSLPSFIYMFAMRAKDGKMLDYDARCTLFKFGNVEILINCGIHNVLSFKTLQRNIRDFCTDGCLEYVVISNFYGKNNNEFFSEKNSKGISTNKKIGLIDYVDVDNFIYNGKLSNFAKKTSDPVVQRFDNNLKYLKDNGTKIIDISKTTSNATDLPNEFVVNGSTTNKYDFALGVYSSEMESEDEDCLSCVSIVTIGDNKYLNIGSFQGDQEGKIFDSFVSFFQKKHKISLNNFSLCDLPDGGNGISFSSRFCKKIEGSSALTMLGSCVKGSLKNNGCFPSSSLFSDLKNAAASNNSTTKIAKPNIYLTGECEGSKPFDNTNTSESMTIKGDSDQNSFMVRIFKERARDNFYRMSVANIYPKLEATTRANAAPGKRIKSPVLY